jgi:hypothetical protein
VEIAVNDFHSCFRNRSGEGQCTVRNEVKVARNSDQKANLKILENIKK